MVRQVRGYAGTLSPVTWSRAAWFIGLLVAIPLGYAAATHPIDVAIYRGIGAQILRHDYQLYAANVSTGFRYAPIVAFLFVPLALMPLWAAALTIYALKVAALVATVRIVARLTSLDRERAARVGLLAFLVASGYLLEEFRTGNIHFLVFFTIVAAMALAERGRILAPSLLMALAVVAKISPLLFIGFFLVTRRVKLASATSIAVLVMLLLPAAVVGASKNVELLKGFLGSAVSRTDEARNHSLKGVLTRLLSDEGPDAGVLPPVHIARLSKHAADVVWYASEVAILAVLGWILFAARPIRGSPLLEYSLVTTAMLILSPFSLRIYFATLFLPCCALAAQLIKEPAHSDRRWIVAALAATGVLGTLLALVPGRRWSLIYEALSPHFIAALIVALALARLLRLRVIAARATPRSV